MDIAKIRLSPEEQELVATPDLILTKNNALQKIKEILLKLQSGQEELLRVFEPIPGEILKSPAKISKGENYKGLPWLVLDYPRHFNREDVFALRTLFWWGNFFSTTLHLSGKHKKQHERAIINSFESLQKENFFVCINENQWEHHFETDNYIPAWEITRRQFEEIIVKKAFIKLAKKIPLEQWNDVEENLLDIFAQLINSLKN